MVTMLNLLLDLVQDYVLIGICSDQVKGRYLRIEYKTPHGDTFKFSEITRTKPGYVMTFNRMLNGEMVNNGHSHIIKIGHLCEVVWREYGQDVAKLLRFADTYPEFKAEILGLDLKKQGREPEVM